jgi:hypothetical protein
VYLENAEDITIDGCRFQQIGGYALYTIGRGVRRLGVTNNLIQSIGGTAVEINGTGDFPNESNHHQILNNHIHHTGMVVPSARGIMIFMSSHNRIANNLLHDIPKGAIGLGGLGIIEQPGTSDNVVEFNEIHSVLQDSQDMGPIYFGGAGPDNVIHNNYLHDIFGLFSFHGCIYMDQGTRGFTITNNLVERIGRQGGGKISGLIDAADIETSIRNNFLVDNNVELSSAIFPREYSIEEQSAETNTAASTPPNDIDVIGNIFYNNDGPIYSFRFGREDSWLRESDYNLFYSDRDFYRVIGIPGVVTLSDWQALEEGRFDQHSLIADLLFLDPGAGDYRLRFDSPAYSLGIEDINQAAIGLTADFPFPSPDSTLGRMHITSDKAGNSAALHLEVGEEAKLQITVRTASGYIAEPGDYQQKCRSDDLGVAAVDHDGEITAKGKGFTQVICSAERDGTRLSLPVFILVDTTIEEAAEQFPPETPLTSITPFLGELERIDFQHNQGVFDHGPSHNFWEISREDDRTMYCNAPGDNYPTLEFGSMQWDDYQVDARIRITGEPDAYAGIRLRNGWGNNWHFYQHDIFSTREEQGVSQIYCDIEDCQSWTGFDIPVMKGEWIRFRAEADGTSIRTFLNGRLLISQTLDLISAGNAGFMAKPGTTLCIDDIVVRSLDRSPEAIALASRAVILYTQQVHLRPAENQQVIGGISGGSEVYIIEWIENQSWALVRWDSTGLQGWVPVESLRMIEDDSG